MQQSVRRLKGPWVIDREVTCLDSLDAQTTQAALHVLGYRPQLDDVDDCLPIEEIKKTLSPILWNKTKYILRALMKQGIYWNK